VQGEICADKVKVCQRCCPAALSVSIGMHRACHGGATLASATAGPSVTAGPAMDGAHVAPAPAPASIPVKPVRTVAELAHGLTEKLEAVLAEARALPEADGAAALVQANCHANAMLRKVQAFRGGRPVHPTTSLTHRMDGPAKNGSLKRLIPGFEKKNGYGRGTARVSPFEASAHEKTKKLARKLKKRDCTDGGFRRAAKEARVAAAAAAEREELAIGKRPMLESEEPGAGAQAGPKGSTKRRRESKPQMGEPVEAGLINHQYCKSRHLLVHVILVS
jgi:hypothetical protein